MLPALSAGALSDLLHLLPKGSERGGTRLAGNPALDQWLRAGEVHRAMVSIAGPTARPVRAILFNKTQAANWTLAWHQDRTIAVRARRDAAGFNTWTVKSGIQHVEPPFALIETMLTVRIHIDAVDHLNAPLLVAAGSHRCGRIKEAEIQAVVERCGTIACLAERGGVWLYRTAILHASAAMCRPGPRRVLQVDYSAEELPAPLEWLGVG